MKRCISLILALLSLVSIASAENTDFSAYSTDQLIELIEVIEAELQSRMSASISPIPSGRYKADVDIKPGKYELVIPSPENYEGVIYVRFFENQEVFDKYMNNEGDPDIYISLHDELSSFAFNMVSGSIITIYGDGCYIKPMSYSWQP